MAYYRFELHSSAAAPRMLQRIRALTGIRPGYWFSAAPDPSCTPFIGTMDGPHFRIRRHIRYQNSFLPCIWGSIHPIAGGSRISVTMFLHPIIAVFMMVWLSIAATGAIGSLLVRSGWHTVAATRFFLAGLSFMLIGFFVEAFKARRLLENAAATPIDESSPLD
jgi:hypothetical protein